MKGQKNSYQKLFYYINFVSFCLLALVFFSLYCHNLTSFSQDLGRHLKLGEIIVQQKNIPKTNLFSYTYPDFPFINHHWLSEVIFFITAKSFGLSSLIILKIIFCSLAFFSLIFLTAKNQGQIISLGWSLIILLIFSQRSEVRPEIFSYFFLSIFLILLNNKQSFYKYFFILPLIQILWVNSHIYFFLGPVLILIFFLNNLIFYQFKDKITLLSLFTFFLVSITSFINPNFINGALFPLSVFKNYGYQIVENQSVFFMSNYFHKLYNPKFVFIFLISLLSFIPIFIKKINLNNQIVFNLGCFIFFSFLGFLAIRNTPIFALTSLVIISKNLFFIKKPLASKLSLESNINLKFLFYIIFIPLCLFLAYQNLSNQKNISNLSDRRFGLGKIKAAENGTNFILDNEINGPVFNNFDIGSFLIYKLYPQYQVFVDGRPEAYPASFFQQTYIPMQENEEKWQEVDNKYNFNFIFFSHTDITPWAISFLKQIYKNKSWRLVFLDDYVIIFVKNNGQNKNIIQKYSIDIEKYNFPCHQSLDCYARIKRISNILIYN